MLHVYGSLVPDNTGSIHWLDKKLEVVSHSDRFFSSKYLSSLKNILKVHIFVLIYLRKLDRSIKKRENDGQPLMSDKDALDGEPSTVDTAQKLKKSKKQKLKEES